MKNVPTVDEVVQHIEAKMGPIPEHMYEIVYKSIWIIVDYARRGERSKAEEFIRLMGEA